MAPPRLLQDPPLPPHSFPQLNILLKNIQKEERRTLSQIYAAYVLVAMSLSSEVWLTYEGPPPCNNWPLLSQQVQVTPGFSASGSTSCPLPAPCSRVAWLALAPPQASCHNDSEAMRAAAPLCLERTLHHCHPPTSGSYNISASLQNNSWVLVGDWLWISVLMAIYCRKNPLWWEMYYPGQSGVIRSWSNEIFFLN